MKRIVTLLDATPAGRANLQAACRLAADVAADVLAVHPVEVPDILPLDHPMGDTVAAAAWECDRAKLVGEEYGVTLQPAICQAYSIVDAVVGVAEQEGADAIGLAAPRGLLGWLRWLGGPGPAIMRRASCPVLLVGAGWRPRVASSLGQTSEHPAERTAEEI